MSNHFGLATVKKPCVPKELSARIAALELIEAIAQTSATTVSTAGIWFTLAEPMQFVYAIIIVSGVRLVTRRTRALVRALKARR